MNIAANGPRWNSYRHWRNRQLIILFQTNSNQRTRISVEISLEHFLPNNKKPETSRGRARGRVFIVMANNIRQLTEITAKVLKKGKKYVPISACASIVQVPNSEPAIVRAGILAEFAMESTTLLYVTKRKDENQVSLQY